MNTHFRSVFTAVFAVLAQLVFTTAVFAWAQNSQSASTLDASPAPTTLIVLADHHIQDHLWPILASTFTRDAAAESESLRESTLIPGNLQIVLISPDAPGPVFPSRIEVELLGRCDSPWDENAPSLPKGPLGWVLGTPGHIAPVIYVNCARINQLLWPSVRSMPDSQRYRATSEAISHIILHEWIHIATQSTAHAERGLMRPDLTAPELMKPITTDEKLARDSAPALK